ncbi:MAG: hypothetical protein KKD18_03560 [Nanoarchaeota archaeon]|nr:hypothetical protein [Nanoarchaeota archaeon]MBU0977467.1 hypothetical protein [Nanoarchaeota archaeon]
MNKEQFFKSLGMTIYESKVLTSFTKLKKANAKELSQNSEVPTNKIYKILRDFESLGLIQTIPNESKTYKLLNLKTFISQKIKEKENSLKEIKKHSKTLEVADQNEFIFSLIRGQKNIMDKLAEHNPKVKKEILGVQRNWKVWGAGLRQMQKTVRKGVDVKIIGVINQETQTRALEWKKTGAKVKAYNKAYGEYPLRFTIFDNKEARITMGKPEVPNPKDYITVWTKSRPLIAILRKQFQDMWKNSMPIERALK